MTITEYRDRIARLTGDLRRFNNANAAIDRIRNDLDDALDEYNAGRQP